MQILFVLCCLIYVIRVLIIRIASSKLRSRQNIKITTDNLPLISIIVPARNEEKNIESCITSILNNNYPKDRYEIVVVNDRSTDNTLQIINNIARENENILIINVDKTGNNNLKGKPGALQAGIDAAHGDIFLMTDADCTVHESWILTYANHFRDSKTGMICSYTNVRGNKLFYYFQASEWLYMHTYGCAGIQLNSVLGCFGNNLAITRQAYEKTGGYENIKFSVTEDLSLLRAVFNAGYKIKYICDKNSLVTTSPNFTFKDYIIQHKRWAIGGTSLGWKALSFIFTSVCIWLAFIIGIIEHSLPMIIIFMFLRVLGDAVILVPVFRILNTLYLFKWIPLSVLFFSFVELILPFALIRKQVVWKGQTFSN